MSVIRCKPCGLKARKEQSWNYQTRIRTIIWRCPGCKTVVHRVSSPFTLTNPGKAR